MPKIDTGEKSYSRLIAGLKRRSDGLSTADLVASTGLPLETVKALLPKASDEFGARLKVTESGEILYSFPQGFKSRYRGFWPSAIRAARQIARISASIGKLVFKVWIAIMLVGYFVLFLALALFALVASVAVSATGSSSRSSSRRGGGLGGFYLTSRIFNLLIRIWFYSELTKPAGNRAISRDQTKKRRPLHHAVYSFIFGDGDPNADWDTRERKAVSAYIQANSGVISLPEFMMLTGLPPSEAETAINGYLAALNGSPEATDDGTIVYRFDEMMMRADKTNRSFEHVSAPLKRLKKFSSNSAAMNRWFAILNAVNFVFGSYFLFFGTVFGSAINAAKSVFGSRLYEISLTLFQNIGLPFSFIIIGLGFIPLSFSLLFYAIPLIRHFSEKKENHTIATENARKELLRRVWSNPERIDSSSVLQQEQDLLKELGSYAQPQLTIDESGHTLYHFPTLAEEQRALEKYRKTIEDFDIGKTIFDSHAD